jgi:aspartokinase
LAAALSGEQPSLEFTACAATWAKNRGGLSFCLPEHHAPRLIALVQENGGQVASSQEVSLISLQGPHFGDRWGIAEQALTALEEAGVEPRLLLGATHTLQVLVDPAAAPRALQGLRGRFSSPEANHD